MGYPGPAFQTEIASSVIEFWSEFWAWQGSQLRYSTTYHPQTDGQTEVVNGCLETYLRCFCSLEPHDLEKWIPWVQY